MINELIIDVYLEKGSRNNWYHGSRVSSYSYLRWNSSIWRRPSHVSKNDVATTWNFDKIMDDMAKTNALLTRLLAKTAVSRLWLWLTGWIFGGGNREFWMKLDFKKVVQTNANSLFHRRYGYFEKNKHGCKVRLLSWTYYLHDVISNRFENATTGRYHGTSARYFVHIYSASRYNYMFQTVFYYELLKI